MSLAKTFLMKSFAISFLLLVSLFAHAGEKVLYSFQGGADGFFPVGGLVSDPSGNLYGVTEFGGNGPCQDGSVPGCGTIFELRSDGKGGWTETLIYAFTGGADGQYPLYGLVLDSHGNLYGTTSGAVGALCSPRCGSVFKLSSGENGWTISVLHAFRGKADGGSLQGGVVLDSSGHVYGTTNAWGPKRGGTTFQLSNSGTNWTLKTIHAFGVGIDGKFPAGLLALGSDGTIYGMTQEGGSANLGVLYSLSLGQSDYWREKVLYSFPAGGKNGGFPVGLTADSQGRLYGVSPRMPVYGDVFQFIEHTKGGWAEKILYNFRPPNKNGPEDPSGPVIVDKSGNVYGTTFRSAEFPDEAGAVYKLTPPTSGNQWSETMIFAFPSDSTNGSRPTGPLLLDDEKNLYGVTEQGGTGCDGGCGTVFEITP
jgi:uncharacterized repeat protein (TIGR03803 family)